MKAFDYTIKDPAGIHARPAGMLVKKVKDFSSKIKISCKGKEADASKLFSVMGLGVKCSDTVSIYAEGDDESKAIAELKEFFEENL